MDQNVDIIAILRKNPEVTRILSYLGITLAVSLASSIWNNILYAFASSANPDSYYAVTIISTIITYTICGLLYRRFVFRSTASAKGAIVFMCVLHLLRQFFAYRLIQLIWRAGVSADASSLSFLLTCSVHTLCYLFQRNIIYRIDEAADQRPITTATSNADGDPNILSVDLDNIEKRHTQAILSRAFGKKASDSSRGISRGLFGRADLNSDNERVIAQSSRDAIRVMEHKQLNMKHEWNCADKNDQPVQSIPGKRVIAPGDYTSIQANEHGTLDIKHEWNCADKNGHPVQATTDRRVIAPGDYTAIQANEHGALDIKHEWNCGDK